MERSTIQCRVVCSLLVLPITLGLVLVSGIGCSVITTSTLTRGIVEYSEPLLPEKHRRKSGIFVIHSHKPIRRLDPVIHTLKQIQIRVQNELDLIARPGHRPIDVYILEDEVMLDHYLTFYHPEMPARRALFLSSPTGNAIYAARGDELHRDLRHEATHAILHHAGIVVPLWLDEGLAEYFELRPEEIESESLIRYKILQREVDEGWLPNLDRLESLPSNVSMTATDYREAWAWTAMFLGGSERPLLLRYIHQERSLLNEPGSMAEQIDLSNQSLRLLLLDRIKKASLVTLEN